MSTRNPDKVEVWAPIFTKYFKDATILDPHFALSRFNTGVWCKLCDAPVVDPETHMKIHARQLKHWRAEREKAAEKAKQAGLARAREERRLLREAGQNS